MIVILERFGGRQIVSLTTVLLLLLVGLVGLIETLLME